MVIAVNVASPIVATYAQSLYIFVNNEYNITKLPKISNIITPKMVVLYISEMSVWPCFKYFLKNTKSGIPIIVILIIVDKNKYKLLFLLYI